jgi:CTP:molybdopterin cytidylyltransferase MocA
MLYQGLHNQTPLPVACVIMAAGVSRRFQEPRKEQTDMDIPCKNKLLAEFSGKPLLQWTLDAFSSLPCLSKFIVARDEELLKITQSTDFQVLWNRGDDLDPSLTIRMAMNVLPSEAAGCLFAVGDQPYLTSYSIQKLCEAFVKAPDKIFSLAWQGKRGNPVIFPRDLFKELAVLETGSSGKSLIQKYPERLALIEAQGPLELMDIDTQEQYLKASQNLIT